ncbi:MAG: NHL repeat-containing protein [Desulfovibrionaceae bacterium]
MLPSPGVHAGNEPVPGGTHVLSITAGKESGPFGQLAGVVYDASRQRLYVCDTLQNRILAFGPDFAFLSEFDGGGALDGPTALARDGKGRFFVAEPRRQRVVMIDMAAKAIHPLEWPEGGNPVYPSAVAVDEAGRLYVADRANARILIFDPAMRFERAVSLAGVRSLDGVAVGPQGQIYAACAADGVVLALDADGTVRQRFGGRDAARGALRFPVAVAVDGHGMIHVLDRHLGMVLIYGENGAFLRSVGRPGWREGRLRAPSHLAVTVSGRVFVVDTQNARVSVFEQ